MATNKKTTPAIKKRKRKNNITKPEHYTAHSTETIKVIQRMTENLQGESAFIMGNIIKYLDRFMYKNGVADLKKAKRYLEMLIEITKSKKKRI